MTTPTIVGALIVKNEERFWAKVAKLGVCSCWEWTGWRKETGYGRVRIDGRILYAHRVSWILANGPIPDDLRVLHRCDNPPCVNPDHLFLGTQGDNNADRDAKGRNFHARKTHCKYGHEFTPENTYVYPTPTGQGRMCLTCRNVRHAARPKKRAS